MLPGLLEALKRREERLTIGPHTLIVRELSSAADLAVLSNVEDRTFRLAVLCVFAEDGTPAFTDEDLPALKASSRGLLGPLFEAVVRVNGWDARANEKN